MAWLLDTNVLSELRRPKPEQKVVDFVAVCALEELHISVVTNWFPSLRAEPS
jgi:predicted nucleic acid-binding protein